MAALAKVASARDNVRKPGILYVIGSFRFGGSERHLLELVRRLDRGRFRPSIAVLHRKGELEPAFAATGVPIYTLGLRSLFSPSAVGRFRELSAFADEQAVDIVHGFNFHGNMYGALIAGPRSGRRLITSERGIVQEVRAHRRLAMRFYHRRSRRMLVNSPEVRDSVARITGQREGWLQILPNGVDTAHYDPAAVQKPAPSAAGLPEGGVLVGHVGRFREEKGQFFMLEAFREVAARVPSARFLLVGGGPDSPAVARVAAEPPLAGRTAILDYQADVRPYLRMMDVFVLPSRTEGMPNALLEAMAMGVACVATRVGGTGELLDHGAAGRIVDYGDRSGLAAALLELACDDTERTRLATEARRRAVERFSMEAMVKGYEGAYDWALGDAS
jgi:glycosyltransferase involved in cell wall biosynthesis